MSLNLEDNKFFVCNQGLYWILQGDKLIQLKNTYSYIVVSPRIIELWISVKSLRYMTEEEKAELL